MLNALRQWREHRRFRRLERKAMKMKADTPSLPQFTGKPLQGASVHSLRSRRARQHTTFMFRNDPRAPTQRWKHPYPVRRHG